MALNIGPTTQAEIDKKYSQADQAEFMAILKLKNERNPEVRARYNALGPVKQQLFAEFCADKKSVAHAEGQRQLEALAQERAELLRQRDAAVKRAAQQLTPELASSSKNNKKVGIYK